MRRAVAVTCVALLVCAAFLCLGGVSLAWVVLASVFVLLPPCAASSVRRDVLPYYQRSVALLAILDSRGPPTRPSLT
jgi:hypothetical protein